MKPYWLLCLLAIATCANAPRPPSLDGLAQQPMDGTLALVAEAKDLQKQAEFAFREGRIVDTTFLSEQAIATLHHARAEKAAMDAETALSDALSTGRDARSSLAYAQGEIEVASNEIERLNNEIAIAQDILGADKTAPNPNLSQARWMLIDANLRVAQALCETARLAAPSAPSLASAMELVDSLLVRATNRVGDPPVESSHRARAACLTAMRAAGAYVINGGQDVEALREALKAYAPLQDERGVFVTIHSPWAERGVSPKAADQLDAIGKIVASFGNYRAIVVGYSNRKRALEPAASIVRAAGVLDVGLLAHLGPDRERIEILVVGVAPKAP
jgi:hypothetical protein